MLSPKLFIKLLIISATGGSPLIYHGIPSEITETEQRQFKWLLNWAGNSEKELAYDKEAKESNKFFVSSSEHKWQGLYADNEIAKLFSGGGERLTKNIYKLFFKREVIQGQGEVKNGKGIRGAIGLVRISSGGAGGDSSQIKIEEIVPEEAKNVYLILAKGKSSIYLMPSVWSEGSTAGNKTQATEKEKEVWEKGVNVASWKDSDQHSKEWDAIRDETIQKSLTNGFVIVRAGNNGNGVGQRNQFDEWLKTKALGFSIFETTPHNTEGNFYYQNAGIVLGKRGERDSASRSGWIMVSEQFNDKRENFFPLDIGVIGRGSILREKVNGQKKLTQEIEIDDTITKVIGVRLDKVVITETGIGEGIEKEIKWGGNVNKPTWASELLK